MANAVIRNNKAYCPNNECGAHNYSITSYCGVESSKGYATQFEARCYECGTQFNYLYKAEVDDDIRFVDQEED